MTARLTKRLAFLTVLISTAALILSAASASAASAAGPAWRLDALANSTVAPGASLQYLMQLNNVGDEPTSGAYTLTASLPPHVTAKEVTLNSVPPFPVSFFGWACTSGDGGPVEGAGVVRCTSSVAVSPHVGANFRVTPVIHAEVGPAASGTLTATFALEGGGAPAVASAAPVRVTPRAPAFGIAAFDASVENADGSAFTQAAGHPADATTSMSFNTLTNPDPNKGALWPVEATKDVLVELPPGFVGNPTVVPQCPLSSLANGENQALSLCDPASQVGTVFVRINGLTQANVLGPIPVFNMPPPPGAPARFGFDVKGTVVVVDARLRSDGDYGLTVNSRDVSEGLPVSSSSFTFWDVPAASVHDLERACPGELQPWETGGVSCPAEPGTPETAFLRNPTSCTAPGEGLRTSLSIDSWANPGAFVEDSFISHNPLGFPYPRGLWGDPQGPTGCDQVPFEPGISVQPTSHQADSPTGLNVDVTVPQQAITEPGAISQSDLEDAVVTLPKGLSVNPASADGLGSCSPAQIGMTTAVGQTPIHFDTADPTCPNSSKLGNLTIKSPLLEEALTGSVYLASQGQNPFGSLLAIYFVAQGSGVTVKLPGHIEPQADGQLVARFDEQPQVPFEKVHVELFGGARASLRTPASCGKYATTATLAPWSGNAPVQLSDPFEITEGPGGGACPHGAFAPKFSAGTVNPIAGAYSPFVLKLSREDGTGELSGLDLTLPPGLAAKFAGVPYCPDSALAAIPTAEGTGAAQLASPSCPAASRVGTVTAGAGAGPDPFYVQTGKAYLAGPYKGAPLSLAIVTPALAGPFDLGNVVVRTALFIDPTTAQGHAVSDPIPTALHGLPLDLRSIEVDLGRNQFTLNPTSCDEMHVTGSATAVGGASAPLTDRFQVGNCAALAFKPKLGLKLKGGTKRGDHPAFSATLTMPAGNANIARAQVSLPHSEFLDQAHIKTICTRVQFAADQCPAGSVYGHAKAVTPLLDQPLEGPVYLRSSDHNLPDLVADLNGQIHVVLDGRIDTHKKGIRNTFSVVPDAPVTKFTLTMQGGKKGLLINSRNLCKSTSKADVQFDGQNGKTHDLRPPLQVKCARKQR